MTFDTAGNLVSPLNGISLDNVVIGGSGNTLNIDIDYVGSTQFSGAFSVNSQSQNGQPNGSLVAVDIADDGLVTASYSNGTQDLKGKIVLSLFRHPTVCVSSVIRPSWNPTNPEPQRLVNRVALGLARSVLVHGKGLTSI